MIACTLDDPPRISNSTGLCPPLWAGIFLGEPSLATGAKIMRNSQLAVITDDDLETDRGPMLFV
jgi:hypothetical protein